jgi:hypothetical protein
MYCRVQYIPEDNSENDTYLATPASVTDIRHIYLAVYYFKINIRKL